MLPGNCLFTLYEELNDYVNQAIRQTQYVGHKLQVYCNKKLKYLVNSCK
jgi:hypothetical protein